jgi:hypothetical protein
MSWDDIKRPSEPYRVLSVWVRISLADRMKARAQAEGRTLRDCVEDALDLWLTQAPRETADSGQSRHA